MAKLPVAENLVPVYWSGSASGSLAAWQVLYGIKVNADNAKHLQRQLMYSRSFCCEHNILPLADGQVYFFSALETLFRRQKPFTYHSSDSIFSFLSALPSSNALNLEHGHFYIGHLGNAAGLVFGSKQQMMSVIEDTAFLKTTVSPRTVIPNVILERDVIFISFRDLVSELFADQTYNPFIKVARNQIISYGKPSIQPYTVSPMARPQQQAQSQPQAASLFQNYQCQHNNLLSNLNGKNAGIRCGTKILTTASLPSFHLQSNRSQQTAPQAQQLTQPSFVLPPPIMKPSNVEQAQLQPQASSSNIGMPRLPVTGDPLMTSLATSSSTSGPVNTDTNLSTGRKEMSNTADQASSQCEPTPMKQRDMLFRNTQDTVEAPLPSLHSQPWYRQLSQLVAIPPPPIMNQRVEQAQLQPQASSRSNRVSRPPVTGDPLMSSLRSSRSITTSSSTSRPVNTDANITHEEMKDDTDQVSVDEHDDFCAICDEGGDLLCCDTCTFTYHLQCVKLKSLPEEQWHCSCCKAKSAIKQLLPLFDDKRSEHNNAELLKELRSFNCINQKGLRERPLKFHKQMRILRNSLNQFGWGLNAPLLNYTKKWWRRECAFLAPYAPMDEAELVFGLDYFFDVEHLMRWLIATDMLALTDRIADYDTESFQAICSRFPNYGDSDWNLKRRIRDLFIQEDENAFRKFYFQEMLKDDGWKDVSVRGSGTIKLIPPEHGSKESATQQKPLTRNEAILYLKRCYGPLSAAATESDATVLDASVPESKASVSDASEHLVTDATVSDAPVADASMCAASAAGPSSELVIPPDNETDFNPRRSSSYQSNKSTMMGKMRGRSIFEENEDWESTSSIDDGKKRAKIESDDQPNELIDEDADDNGCAMNISNDVQQHAEKEPDCFTVPEQEMEMTMDLPPVHENGTQFKLTLHQRFQYLFDSSYEVLL